MEKLVQWFEKIFNRLPKMAQIFLIAGIYAVFQMLAPVLLFDYSSELGVFWIVILIIYTGLLVFAAAWLFHRREIRYLEAMYGTEFVLDAFPREKRRRERKAERKEREMKKRAVKHSRKAEREARRLRDKRDAGLL